MEVLFSPPDIIEADIEEVVEALKSGWITTGPKTKKLEKDIASLNSDTISGSIDVTNLPIGIHEVELILDLDEGKYGYLPVKVMVYITDASAPEVNAP